MKAKNSVLLLIISWICLSCCFSCTRDIVSEPLLSILSSSEDPAIQKVMENPDIYNIQIHYTRIDRNEDNLVFTEYRYQEEDSTYFYPASTVKLPIAVMALEKISREDGWNLNTKFYVEGDSLETTFAEEVIKIFAVSDNEANNRLFEFLGQNSINDGLRRKKVGPARIAHRLSTENADDVTTKPLVIYLNDSSTVNLEPTINDPLKRLKLQEIEKGQGFMIGDSLVSEPFDFSLKNYYPLSTQQQVLKRIIFPEEYPDTERFYLGPAERELLLKAMSTTPRHWGYDSEEYYDSYVKFFLYGDSHSVIPDYVKIFNKVGYAYGTLTDCAYILDTKNKIDFFLSATILVNEDQIFNDDKYEYEETGIPFLAALGREIYNYELNRKR